MNSKATAQIGLVLGIVFIVMGLAYSTSSLWMLGGILLAIGLSAKFRKTDSD